MAIRNIKHLVSGFISTLSLWLIQAEVVLAADGYIQNPISSDDFTSLLKAVLKIIIEIGIPLVILGVIFIGFKFIKAQGNPGELKQAKDGFKWVLVGAAIVLGAYVISAILQATVSNVIGS